MVEFNSCSHLVEQETIKEINAKYDEILANGKSPFDFMLNLQETLQKDLSKRYQRELSPKALFERGNKGQLADYIQYQQYAINNEIDELLNAIAGTSLKPSEQSSIWKKWKSNHDELRSQSINHLTHDEKLERSFEMIDIMHFIYCMLLSLGIDERELFVLYCLKNKENMNRYENKY